MEGGKRGEEAGPSSGGGSSSASASASGVVGDQRQEKQKEMSEKPSQVCGVVEEGDEEEEEVDVKDEGVVDGFVPGPLLSLKEQIEKDKVFFLSLSIFYLSLFKYKKILGLFLYIHI
jgi:Rho GDP-dissociation inhibitor